MGVAVKGGVGVAVEVNSETDFVARNSDFQAIVRAIAEVATGCADIEALRGAPLGEKTVEEAVTEKIATIGENLHLRRMVVGRGRERRLLRPQRGRRRPRQDRRAGGAEGRRTTASASRSPCTSRRPARRSLSEADLDPALIEREKAILTEQARESGKPEAVIEKMIVGRMKKFFEEVTLLEPEVRHQPRHHRRPGGQGRRRRGDRLRPPRRRRGRREGESRTSPPRSPRPPAADRGRCRRAAASRAAREAHPRAVGLRDSPGNRR